MREQMMKSAIGIATLALAGAVAGVASADEFTWQIKASIHDAPRVGLGDTFNLSPFEGLLRQVASQEDRAILEYDVSVIPPGCIIWYAALLTRMSRPPSSLIARSTIARQCASSRMVRGAYDWNADEKGGE